jgi:hypothetical protein
LGNEGLGGPVAADGCDPQEIIEYCESRLQAICNALDNAAKHGDRAKIDRIMDGLRMELVRKYIP